jgi:hypothetical protein
MYAMQTRERTVKGSVLSGVQAAAMRKCRHSEVSNQIRSVSVQIP